MCFIRTTRLTVSQANGEEMHAGQERVAAAFIGGDFCALLVRLGVVVSCVLVRRRSCDRLEECAVNRTSLIVNEVFDAKHRRRS